MGAGVVHVSLGRDALSRAGSLGTRVRRWGGGGVGKYPQGHGPQGVQGVPGRVRGAPAPVPTALERLPAARGSQAGIEPSFEPVAARKRSTHPNRSAAGQGVTPWALPPLSTGSSPPAALVLEQRHWTTAPAVHCEGWSPSLASIDRLSSK